MAVDKFLLVQFRLLGSHPNLLNLALDRFDISIRRLFDGVGHDEVPFVTDRHLFLTPPLRPPILILHCRRVTGSAFTVFLKHSTQGIS